MEVVLAAAVTGAFTLLGLLVKKWVGDLDKENTRQHGENAALLAAIASDARGAKVAATAANVAVDGLANRIDRHLEWHANQEVAAS